MTMAAIFTNISAGVTGITGIVTDVASMIVGEPLLLLGIAGGLLFTGIAVVRKFA